MHGQGLRETEHAYVNLSMSLCCTYCVHILSGSVFAPYVPIRIKMIVHSVFCFADIFVPLSKLVPSSHQFVGGFASTYGMKYHQRAANMTVLRGPRSHGQPQGASSFHLQEIAQASQPEAHEAGTRLSRAIRRNHMTISGYLWATESPKIWRHTN